MKNCDLHNKVYDEEKYRSCYDCYLDFLKTLIECMFCGRLHGSGYEVCFSCQQIKGREKMAKELRIVIFSRDDFTCQLCQNRDPDINVDVILPHSKGGRTVQWNLGLLCAECNLTKRDEYRPMDETRRNRLIDYYWTAGFQFLSQGEQELLRHDVFDREGLSVDEVDQAFAGRRVERAESDRLRRDVGL